MSNRAGRSEKKGNLRIGQTKKHQLAVDDKKWMQARHLGKYATAKDIQARILTARAASKAARAFRLGLNG